MNDANENNLDDNIELLGYLGAAEHLRGQEQIRHQNARQLEEVRRLREATQRSERRAKRSEQRAKQEQEAEQARLEAMPQCPFCGGRLEGRFPKCKHCASELSWVGGNACEPGKEDEMRTRLSKLKEPDSDELEAAELNFKIDKVTSGLPVRCPFCDKARPGTYRPNGKLRVTGARSPSDILFAVQAWADSMNRHDCCPDCEEEVVESRNMARKRRKEADSWKRFGVFLVLLLAVAYVMSHFVK